MGFADTGPLGAGAARLARGGDSSTEDSTTIAGSGTVLGGRYRLHTLIGHGSSADVYAGTDERLGRPVAVKVFKAHLTDPTNLARQQSEMQLSAGLNHPNLVIVHDAQVPEPSAAVAALAAPSAGTLAPAYLVMELVSGRTLADLLATGPMAEALVRRMAIGLADALCLIHSRGLVHRDIKPANILITDTGTAKLSDFGIARLVDAAHLTATQDVIGTAAYLSPEQARGGHVDPATDIYALGLVLLESLTGRREFPGPPLESALGRLHRNPVIAPTLPEPWPAILTAMTTSDSACRPTAASLLDMLRPAPKAAEHPASINDSPTSQPVLSEAIPDPPGVHDPTLIEPPRDAGATPTESRMLWTPVIGSPARTRRRRQWIGGSAAIAVAVGTAFLIAVTNRDIGTQTPTNQTPPASTGISAATGAPSGGQDPLNAATPPPSDASAPAEQATTTIESPTQATTVAPAVTQTVTSTANGTNPKPSSDHKTKPPKPPKPTKTK
jgi:serine/threonine protein kinase